MRLSILAVALVLAAVAAILLGPLAHRARMVELLPALGLVAAGVLLALAALVVAVVAIAGGSRLVGGIVAIVALGMLALPAWHVLAALTSPRIHDITTDLDDPPAFEAVLPLRAGAPNPPEHPGDEVAAVQRGAWPDLRPLVLDLPPDEALARAARAARDLGLEIVAEGDGRLEAVATSAWFGFRDDVVVRVRARNGGSVVDIRSKSRIGESDLGANAARVRALLERIEAG
jgi:uncharacterized protein (DUF1499 family)